MIETLDDLAFVVASFFMMVGVVHVLKWIAAWIVTILAFRWWDRKFPNDS